MESWNRDERSRYLILRETRGNFPASRAGRTISISRQSRRQSSARRIRFFELGTAGVTFRETELTRAAGAPHGMKYTDRAPFWRCCMPSCPGSERQVRLSKSDLPPLSSPVSEYRKFFHRADSFHVRLSLSLSRLSARSSIILIVIPNIPFDGENDRENSKFPSGRESNSARGSSLSLFLSLCFSLIDSSRTKQSSWYFD